MCVRSVMQDLRFTLKRRIKPRRHTDGDERLHAELKANGVAITEYKVRVLRQRMRLFCIQKKHYKCTTNSNHSKTVAPNLLEQNFTVTRPNQVWVSDITYLWTNEGWLYLAGIKDLYSCEIVGYAIGERMTAGLCIAALQMALLRRKPKAGLILHSDRGNQYCAKAYQFQLSKAGIVASMMPQKVTVMIMRLWRVSGVHSKMN